jgi:hypothetical protein
MARTVDVPVLKPLTYQGHSYVRGELVSMRPIEAAARARRGEVSLTRGVVIPRDVEPEPEPEPETPRRRRTYRRRDMTAESTTEPEGSQE